MPNRIQPLSLRILSRLSQAYDEEPDPWFRDDLQVASLIVAHAARGDAVLCTPDVLASYEVLGLHPLKVWPAIEARRNALGPLCAVPKKPPQSVKLWFENKNGAKAANSRAVETGLLDHRIPPMATASIAALYLNSDAPSSAKKRGFTYEEMLAIVEFSGAPHSVRQGTLSALKARGRWPNEDGPVTGVICISLIGMMLHGVCCRSTARWRARRACKLGYWRELRGANSWSNCPQCTAKRDVGKCEQCGYVGRAKTPDGKPNFDEFCRPFMYEVDIEKFRQAPRCRELRHFQARTYAEYKQAAKTATVTEFPRKSPQPAPPADPIPPATAAPIRQPAAEHAHRNPARPQSVVTTEISARSTKAAQLLMEMCGLADLGAVPQIAISIAAEAHYRGVSIEDAARHIAECATRDQKNGVALTRFYFRDLKWRTSNGERGSSAGHERAERSKRNILEGLLRNARGPDAPDGPERQE